MERLIEKLGSTQAALLRNVLASGRNDRDAARVQLQELKHTLEELELVAQAAAPASADAITLPAALTPEFYATYLLVLLLADDLNDARFLWKRTPPTLKQASEPLRMAWAVGKALWQRDFAAAYAAMDASWPVELVELVQLLRDWTRESAAALLSAAYSTLSLVDAAHALGFAQRDELVQYCLAREWTVDTDEQLVRPKPAPRARHERTGLEQLATLSQFVLHLEQSTVVKLP